MPRDSLHTVFLAAKLLGVHCNGCSHRAVLGAAELPKMHNNMTLLRSLKLRCKNCGLRGTGRREFALSIPREELEAEAFLQAEYQRMGRERAFMAFVQFTQPDDQPVVVNTERIVTAAPMPPDGVGTRITFTNGGHQDVKELITNVLRRLNINA